MKANQDHMKVMKKMMTLCLNVKEYGVFIDPDGERNGKTLTISISKFQPFQILITPKTL
jgi:hypothetical protein